MREIHLTPEKIIGSQDSVSKGANTIFVFSGLNRPFFELTISFRLKTSDSPKGLQ